MNNPTQAVSNFLVPATGTTNAMAVAEEFSATPVRIDFNLNNLDGLPFRPSGVMIDNTANADPLRVLINEISFAITCPGGAFMEMPYPAPLNHTVNITGNGQGTVIFVDYPVQPFSSASGGGGGSFEIPLPVVFDGPQPVAVTSGFMNVEVVGAPLSVQQAGPAFNVQGGDWLTDSQLRSNPVPVVIGSGGSTTLTGVITNTTGTGDTPAGAVSVTIKNVGAAVGTAAFGNLPAGESVSYNAPLGTTLNAISYDATGTEFLVSFTI